MIFLLILIFLVIIAFEVPGLIRQKLWRELAAFSVLLIIGMIYSFGPALNLPVPNPTRGIEYVFKPVGNFIERILS